MTGGTGPQPAEDPARATAPQMRSGRVEEANRATQGFRLEAYGSYAPSMGRDTREDGAETNYYGRQLVRRHFPRDCSARIVDLGCGDGSLLAVAAKTGYRQLSGVDLSAEHVAAAHRRGLMGVVQGDILTHLGNAADGSFDLVLTMDVIEHLTQSEALLLAREVHRVLAPMGQWVVHTPNGASPLFGRIRYGDLTHETAHTTSSMAQLFRLAGFERFDFFEDTPVVHGVASACRAVGWLFLRTLLRAALAVETGNAGASEVFSQNLLAIAAKRGAGSHDEG